MNYTRIYSNQILKSGPAREYGKTSDAFFSKLADYAYKGKSACAVWALLRVSEDTADFSPLLKGMTTTGVTLKNLGNIIRLMMMLPKDEISTIRTSVNLVENAGVLSIFLTKTAGTHALNHRTQRVVSAIGNHCSKLPMHCRPFITHNCVTPEDHVRLHIPLHQADWLQDHPADTGGVLGEVRPVPTYVGMLPKELADWDASKYFGQTTVKLSDLKHPLDNINTLLAAITAGDYNGYDALLRSKETITEFIKTHLGVAALKRLLDTVRMNTLSPVKLYETITFSLMIVHKGDRDVGFCFRMFPTYRAKADAKPTPVPDTMTEPFEYEYLKFIEEYDQEPVAPWLCFYDAATFFNPTTKTESTVKTTENQTKPTITFNDECSLYRRFQGKLLTAIKTGDDLTKAFNEDFHGCALNVDFVPVVNTGGGIKRNHRTLCVTFAVKTSRTPHHDTLASTTGKLIDFFVGKMRIAGHKTKTKAKNNACVLAYFNLGEGYTCCEFTVNKNLPGSLGVTCDLKTASHHFAEGEVADIQLSFYHREWVVGSDDGATKEFEKARYERLGAGTIITRADIALFGVTKKEVRALAGKIAARYEHMASPDLNDLFSCTRFVTTDLENIYNGITISSHGTVLNGPAIVVGGAEQYTQYLTAKQAT